MAQEQHDAEHKVDGNSEVIHKRESRVEGNQEQIILKVIGTLEKAGK